MAGNRPLRPGEQPPLAGSPGGGGGQQKKKRRPNAGGGGGDGKQVLPGIPLVGGGGGGGATQKGFDFSGIAADPGAWLRGQMTQAGFDVNAVGPYATFLNSAVIDPFVAGWDTYQTTNTGRNVTIGDYIASQGWGTPQPTNGHLAGLDAPGRPYTRPSGRPSRRGDGGPTAPNMAGFWDYVNAVIARYSPQARGVYDSGKDRGGTRWSVYV